MDLDDLCVTSHTYSFGGAAAHCCHCSLRCCGTTIPSGRAWMRTGRLPLCSTMSCQPFYRRRRRHRFRCRRRLRHRLCQHLRRRLRRRRRRCRFCRHRRHRLHRCLCRCRRRRRRLRLRRRLCRRLSATTASPASVDRQEFLHSTGTGSVTVCRRFRCSASIASAWFAFLSGLLPTNPQPRAPSPLF